MEQSFTMTHLLRTTLAINDDLGFPNAYEAARAILNNPKWEEKYNLSREDADILGKWRRSILSSNKNQKS